MIWRSSLSCVTVLFFLVPFFLEPKLGTLLSVARNVSFVFFKFEVIFGSASTKHVFFCKHTLCLQKFELLFLFVLYGLLFARQQLQSSRRDFDFKNKEFPRLYAKEHISVISFSLFNFLFISEGQHFCMTKSVNTTFLVCLFGLLFLVLQFLILPLNLKNWSFFFHKALIVLVEVSLWKTKTKHLEAKRTKRKVVTKRSL